MRENSGLWIALLVVGGLLLAGVAGLVGVGILKTRTVQRDATEERKLAEAKLAEAEAKLAHQKQQKGTTPVAKASDPATPEPPADATAAEKWANADIREYAAKLHKDYQGNVVAADNKYKGKTVGVVGEVFKVDSLKGKPVVILKAGAAEFGIVVETVWCVCDNADRDKLAALADGHWIALVGQCTGKGAVGGFEIGSMIMIQDCNVVHVARTEAEMNQAFQKK